MVDLYTAEVLTALAEFGKLPQPDWDSIKVVITGRLSRMYRRQGRRISSSGWFPHGLPAKALAAYAWEMGVITRARL